MSEVVLLDSIQVGPIPTSKGTSEGTILSYTNSRNEKKEQKIYHFFKQNLANEIADLKLAAGDKIKLTFTKNDKGFNDLSKVEKVDASTALGSDKPTFRPYGGAPSKQYDTTGPRIGNAITNAVNLVIAGIRKDIKKTCEELLLISCDLEKFMKTAEQPKPSLQVLTSTKPAETITHTSELDISDLVNDDV